MDAPQHDCGPAHEALRRRTIVLVGLMGAGKTSVGKRLAALDKICALPCSEYTNLKKAIARYKAAGNKSVSPGY